MRMRLELSKDGAALDSDEGVLWGKRERIVEVIGLDMFAVVGPAK
jgi:hypothetical protein